MWPGPVFSGKTACSPSGMAQGRVGTSGPHGGGGILAFRCAASGRSCFPAGVSCFRLARQAVRGFCPYRLRRLLVDGRGFLVVECVQLFCIVRRGASVRFQQSHHGLPGPLRRQCLRLPGFRYPASGYRTSGSGIFDSVGIVGFCRSGTCTAGVGGLYLTFVYGRMSPGATDSRSYGFPVRCVQAFTAVRTWRGPASGFRGLPAGCFIRFGEGRFRSLRTGKSGQTGCFELPGCWLRGPLRPVFTGRRLGILLPVSETTSRDVSVWEG